MQWPMYQVIASFIVVNHHASDRGMLQFISMVYVKHEGAAVILAVFKRSIK